MSARRSRPSALDSDLDEPEPTLPTSEPTELELYERSLNFEASTAPRLPAPVQEVDMTVLSTVQQVQLLCDPAQSRPHNQVLLVPLQTEVISIESLALFAYGLFARNADNDIVKAVEPDIKPPPNALRQFRLGLSPRSPGLLSESVFLLDYPDPRSADAAARLTSTLLDNVLDDRQVEVLRGNWERCLAGMPGAEFSEETWVQQCIGKDSALGEYRDVLRSGTSDESGGEDETVPNGEPEHRPSRSHRTLHITNLPRTTDLYSLVVDLDDVTEVLIDQVKLEVAQKCATGDALVYFESPGDCQHARKKLQGYKARPEDGRLVRSNGQAINVALAAADFAWWGETQTWDAFIDDFPERDSIELQEPAKRNHDEDTEHHIFVAYGLPAALTAEPIDIAIRTTGNPTLDSLWRVETSQGKALAFFRADHETVKIWSRR